VGVAVLALEQSLEGLVLRAPVVRQLDEVPVVAEVRQLDEVPVVAEVRQLDEVPVVAEHLVALEVLADQA
jgi:hypothetical protein